MGKGFKSIKEMKKMFHNPSYSKIVVYGYKHVSVYVTRVMLMLPFSANFWTFMIFILTAASAAFLGIGGYSNQVIGLLLLHSAFLTDVCDGEVALYRNTFSKRGKFLDYLGHGIFPAVFFALGLGVARATGDIIYIYMGASSMFFHSFCNHNRWAFLSTVQKDGGSFDNIKKKDSFARKAFRFMTMGNFEFETGTLIFVLVLLRLDWLAVGLFAVWLPLKWIFQTIVFYTDFLPDKTEKRIKQSF